MKKLAIMILTVAAWTGCSSMDLSEVHRITDYTEPVIDSTDRRYWTEDTFLHDTVLRFVAVEAEDGYDWQRDLLGGVFHGKITMFRNLRPVLSLDFGPEDEISPDYATHFIIGEHLYTYYSSDAVSVVKCDGKDIMRVNGHEILKGLLPTDSGTLTLSKRVSENVFTVRQDGRSVFEFQADAVFGSMMDDGYPLSGALYTDGGKVYFSYRTTVAGGSAYYIVENMVSRVLTPPLVMSGYDIKDIRIIDGEINYFAITGGKQACMYRNGNLEVFDKYVGYENYYDGRILYGRGTSTSFGCYTYSSNKLGRTLFFPLQMNTHHSFSNDGFVIPGTGGANSLLKVNNIDYLIYHYESGKGPRSGAGCRCFSHRSCACLNDYIGVAFTPKESSLKPYIWLDGDTVQVNISNGYITALTLTDSVTTIPGGFHPELVQQ